MLSPPPDIKVLRHPIDLQIISPLCDAPHSQVTATSNVRDEEKFGDGAGGRGGGGGGEGGGGVVEGGREEGKLTEFLMGQQALFEKGKFG